MLARVLQSKDEIASSTEKLNVYNLNSHHDSQKNWDTLQALHSIHALGLPNPTVLDSGSGQKSVILQWLRKTLPLSRLYACDQFTQNLSIFKDNDIDFVNCDISKTPYESLFFDAVVSISVIEHGVDLSDFLSESYRILKPGGCLVVSTDYWHDSIDTSHKYPYGTKYGPMKIFTKDEVLSFVELAAQLGFEIENFNPTLLSCNDKCVYWSRMEEFYTFLFLKFVKL
jgi:ubiquinone/menaquinone biosynthesis C-methylase UbiE